MTEDFLKAIMESSKEDGYNDARNEWHKKMISLMKWAHEQATLNEDNIKVYIAYEKCFDKLDEVLDGDFGIIRQTNLKHRFLDGDKYDF